MWIKITGSVKETKERGYERPKKRERLGWLPLGVRGHHGGTRGDGRKAYTTLLLPSYTGRGVGGGDTERDDPRAPPTPLASADVGHGRRR